MDSKELQYLVVFLSIIALIGFGFSVTVAIVSVSDKSLYELPLCFNDQCVSFFIESIQSALTIASSTLGILVSVATIGGIIVALLSYLNNSNTSALSNHIAHFSVFHNYLAREITNLTMVSPTSVDILSFYNCIFNKSRSGKTDVSGTYIKIINAINYEIKKSNGKAQNPAEGSFRYKEHQGRIIDILKSLGITMTFLPRNDFFDAEGQVFSLIEKVNQSFCYTGSVPILDKRVYI